MYFQQQQRKKWEIYTSTPLARHGTKSFVKSNKKAPINVPLYSIKY